METEYYPNLDTVQNAIQADDPLLVLIAYDESRLLVSNIDDAGEHYILLKKLNHRETELDTFFRIIVNSDGADWTFVCPSEYKGIGRRDMRINTFFNDGISTISRALKQLGYDVQINIPKRYRRHLDALSE